MELTGHPSIVVAGLWNRRILTPKWLFAQIPDLLPEKDMPLEIELNSGALKFEIKDIGFIPEANKLLLFAKNREQSTYKFVEKIAQDIVTKLLHTPFVGVGHNIEYSIDEKEILKLFPDDLLDSTEKFYKSNARAITLDKYESVHRVGYENFTLNVTHHVSKTERKLAFNYHYPADNYKKIIEYAAKLRENIEHSKKLVSSLVG